MRKIRLTELMNKEVGKVVRIDAGRMASNRLSGLGITPGTEIKKVSSAPFQGPVQVQVRGTRLALGRGIASKIIIAY